MGAGVRLRARHYLYLGLAAGLGCSASLRSPLSVQPVVQVETRPGLEERAPFRRVAVAPFRVAPGLARREDPQSPSGEEAALLVARHVSEAIEERGVDVIHAADLRRATGDAGGELPTPELARLAAERFGADAVLVGTVLRYQERVGQAAGSTRPAAVGFEVTLHGAPDGQPLWRATFDERQQALSENVLNAARYPGRGSRWLSAGELARWGASEVALAMPVGESWPSK